MAQTADTGETRDQRRTGNWLLALGILALILGVLGLGMTTGLTLAGVIWYGVLLVILGVAAVIEALFGEEQERRWLGLLLGVVYIVAGAAALLHPVAAIVAITLLIALSLIAFGVVRAIWAFTLPGAAKAWGIVAGLLSVVLGAMILLRWPVSSTWVIGLFIAIDLIVYGVTAAAVGLRLRRDAPAATAVAA